MTVHVSSPSKDFTDRCDAIFRAYGYEVTPILAETDILILDASRSPVVERGRILTVVVSAWIFQRHDLPDGALFFRRPVDVEHMCDLVMRGVWGTMTSPDLTDQGWCLFRCTP